jgi:hypothetical protein
MASSSWKVIEVLAAVAAGEMSMRDVCEKTCLTEATVSRILAELVVTGWVVQVRYARYALGPAFPKAPSRQIVPVGARRLPVGGCPTCQRPYIVDGGVRR